MSRYVETEWSVDGRAVVIAGRVDGDEIRGFAAEDADRNPILIPDALMPVALQRLIDRARAEVTS